MEIRIGATICDGCGGDAIVGLGEAPLCGPCFDGALEQQREQIDAVLEAMERAEFQIIRSPLFTGDDEP